MGWVSVTKYRQVAVMNPIGLPFVTKVDSYDPNRAQTAKGAGTEQGVATDVWRTLWCRN